ncbi:hypothetical protein OC846_005895 [Tilletia horrida]|uniref:JmjC domain-containing protein n=1 Tax=Tilletia horrida TaxID=155126 RepID=A0AAN6GKE9_9BASI|nr:hypothetical protein OC846_005895 [Tilletia horrida]
MSAAKTVPAHDHRSRAPSLSRLTTPPFSASDTFKVALRLLLLSTWNPEGAGEQHAVVMFRKRDGTLLPTAQQAELKPQPDDCCKSARIGKKDWCHVCLRRQQRQTKDSTEDDGLICAWRGFRAIDPRPSQAGHVQEAFLEEHDESDADQAVLATKEASMFGADPSLTGLSQLYAANEYAQGITILLEQELDHVSQVHQRPLTRPFPKDDERHACDTCVSSMLGSWMCQRCGTELCLVCFDNLKENMPLGGITNANTVWACKLSNVTSRLTSSAQDNKNNAQPNFTVHNPASFFPVARLSKPQLEFDLMMARVVQDWTQQGASTFVSNYATTGMYEKNLLAETIARLEKQIMNRLLDSQEHEHLKGEALNKKVAEVLKTEVDKKGLRFWSQVRTETSRIGGREDKAAVIVIPKQDSRETRVRRVMEAALLATEPFLVEQGVVEPLDDKALESVLPPETPVKLKIQLNNKTETDIVDWNWRQVVHQLTCSDEERDIAYLDIRDGALKDLGGSATEMFAEATACPGSRGFYTKTDDPERKIQALGDVACWTSVVRRDAEEKFYVALANWDSDIGDTTSLHVDEAGAANFAAWAKLTDAEIRAKERPVVAEWLVWRPTARRHFEAAAKACLERGVQDAMGSKFTAENWDCDHALYGQALTATDKFLKVLEEVGGEECRAKVIRQRLGETVVILPGFPHQVRNLRHCLKIAKDLMTPTGIPQMLQVLEERARACATADLGRDACAIKPTLYRAWRAVLGQLLRDESGKRERPLATMAAMASATGSALERQAKLSRAAMERCREAEAELKSLKEEVKKYVTERMVLELAGKALLEASKSGDSFLS